MSKYLVSLQDEEKELSGVYLFNNFEEYYQATFSPDVLDKVVLCLEVKGKNYRARQSFLRDLAIDCQSLLSSSSGGCLSYGELAELSSFFCEHGKKYGLLKEFRENAIC